MCSTWRDFRKRSKSEDLYSDYIVNHERTPGIGPLAGWRGENGDEHGRGSSNPNQLERYIENGCFWQHHLPPEQQYYKHANKDYLEFAAHMGFIPKAEQIVMQIYSEPMQKFRLAAEGHGDIQPPDSLRQRIQKLCGGVTPETWSFRIGRVFGIDIQTCPTCGGAMRIIACIEDPNVIELSYRVTFRVR